MRSLLASLIVCSWLERIALADHGAGEPPPRSSAVRPKRPEAPAFPVNRPGVQDTRFTCWAESAAIIGRHLGWKAGEFDVLRELTGGQLRGLHTPYVIPWFQSRGAKTVHRSGYPMSEELKTAATAGGAIYAVKSGTDPSSKPFRHAMALIPSTDGTVKVADPARPHSTITYAGVASLGLDEYVIVTP